MAEWSEIKQFRGGGMDTNSAPEDVAPNDTRERYNFRVTGTQQDESGYGTNPESTTLITESLPSGINKGIGGGSFEDIGKIVYFRYNSAGNHQIVVYSKDTQTEQVIYEDLTDSDGQQLLPLDPRNYIKAILVNSNYLIWAATGNEVGYTNLSTLTNGGYGTVLAEDLSLLKPQCLLPPTGVYGSDAGQPANYLYGNLPQFSVQYVNADYNYSAWSTWSKRIVPYQENTPTLGADVTKNNYIIVSVYAGSIRATTINIAARFGTAIFAIIKSVDRSYATALPDTSVDVLNEVYEAYNPSTNIYSFVYYNNDVAIPVAATETDLSYDYIWPANTVGLLNGNIVALADLQAGYSRPTTPVTIRAVGYNPNIDIPSGTYPNPLTYTIINPGQSGSGAGGHKRIFDVMFFGVPHTGDVIKITLYNLQNATDTVTYTYTVPMAQDGDLDAVIGSLSGIVQAGNYKPVGDAADLQFRGDPFFQLQNVSIQLFFAGATVTNSIPSVLDNTVYQLALSYRDKRGRFFPLETGNTFIVPTPSYAQVNGQAVQIAWQINDINAPDGAVDYQWLLTKPPVNSMIDVIGTPLNYKGGWDAKNNTPSLAANVGTVGDTYQITTPSATNGTVNLGSGNVYDTGDYVTYNGQSWEVLPKSFGDLTSTGNILAISINPLNLFNSEYSDQGIETILSYDFSAGDRCTLHYYINGGNKVFLNNPCVNLSVIGYDAANYIVKVEKSATFDTSILTGKNVFLRLYSPAKADQSASATQNGTVWYEIGERFTISDGIHDTLTGIITDGGVYYKTRQYPDALSPYANPPVQVLSTDFNYSDFYSSAYSSFGRPRTYYDELEKTERKAIIATSQNYILGSKNNGLTRFYPADIYGEANGQTSASMGAIQVLWQRGDVLLAIQELGIFYIPVNYAYLVLNEQVTGTAISEKLLNNGRYDTLGIGIGTAKEAFCYNENIGFMVDPHRSEVFELTTGGVVSISGKISKYLKQVLSLAYAQGKKIVLFYNRYYDELMVCIETEGGVLTLFPFSDSEWNAFDNYNIVPASVTAVTNGAHSTASYNGATGVVTYTPTTDYVGNDTGTFTFNTVDGPVTKNLCLTWVAGTTTVNPFSFAPKTAQPISTLESSNTILVAGNNVPVPISITGGQYSVNGGVFTSSSGYVNAGDVVQVRVMTSGSYDTPVSAMLTISATSATFTVTTGNIAVNPFSFTDVAHQPLNTYIVSNAVNPTGNTLPSPISVTGDVGSSYRLNGGAWTNTSGLFNPGDTVEVRVTSANAANTAKSVTLTIDGQSDTFTVTTKVAVSLTAYNYECPFPFVDANLIVNVNGVDVGGVYSNGDSATFTCLEGDAIIIKGSCIYPSTAGQPQIRLVFYNSIDGQFYTSGFVNITPVPPPDFVITHSFTAEGGKDYSLYVDSTDGSTGFYVGNFNSGQTFAYNILDSVGGITSSGTIASNGLLDIQAILVDSAHDQLQVFAPIDGTYAHQLVNTYAVESLGTFAAGDLMYSIVRAAMQDDIDAGLFGDIITITA